MSNVEDNNPDSAVASTVPKSYFYSDIAHIIIAVVGICSMAAVFTCSGPITSTKATCDDESIKKEIVDWAYWINAAVAVGTFFLFLAIMVIRESQRRRKVMLPRLLAFTIWCTMITISICIYKSYQEGALSADFEARCNPSINLTVLCTESFKGGINHVVLNCTTPEADLVWARSASHPVTSAATATLVPFFMGWVVLTDFKPIAVKFFKLGLAGFFQWLSNQTLGWTNLSSQSQASESAWLGGFIGAAGAFVFFYLMYPKLGREERRAPDARVLPPIDPYLIRRMRLSA